jgi:hypothetical protein
VRGWPRALLFLLLIAASAAPVGAQIDPPKGEAAAYLPAAARFGDGWSLSRAAALDVDVDAFREGAMAALTGPDGTRVLAAVLLVTQDRVAIRRSWEAALSLFDNYSGELEYVTGRDDELSGEPPPSGCIEAKRIDGTARQLGIDTGIPMGVTLCAAEPDLIVLTVVSGTVFELGGFAASDAIASLIVTTPPTAAAEP